MWRLFRRRLRAAGASASLAEARSRGERAEAGHRFERDLDEELAFHLQSRIDDHVRRGLSPADAERRARLEFGGVDKYKEHIRDARPFALLDDLARDLTYAWRSLRRTPVFATTAIVAIALGVAVNAGLVTLVYALVLRPLPVKDPGTIRNVFMSTRGGGSRGTYGTPYFVSFPEFVFMRSQSRAIGLLLAAGGGRLIRTLIFGVSPVDPITFAATALALFGAATLAAIVPAVAALRLDPMIALRDE